MEEATFDTLIDRRARAAECGQYADIGLAARDTVAALADGTGFAAITGPAGSGKTAVLRDVAKLLEQPPVRIIHAGASGGTLTLSCLLTQVAGPAAETATEPDIERAHERLMWPVPPFTRTVLMIDDAHELQPGALNYLALVSRLSAGSAPGLQIVFAGLPALWAKLDGSGLRPLLDRINVRVELAEPTFEQEAGRMPLVPLPASAWPELALSARSEPVRDFSALFRVRRRRRRGGLAVRLVATVMLIALGSAAPDDVGADGPLAPETGHDGPVNGRGPGPRVALDARTVLAVAAGESEADRILTMPDPISPADSAPMLDGPVLAAPVATALADGQGMPPAAESPSVPSDPGVDAGAPSGPASPAATEATPDPPPAVPALDPASPAPGPASSDDPGSSGSMTSAPFASVETRAVPELPVASPAAPQPAPAGPAEAAPTEPTPAQAAPAQATPAQAASAPAASGPPVPPAVSGPPPPSRPTWVATMVRRGDDMLRLGDVDAARLLYARAAEAGDGGAALALGRTHDPRFLREIGARGIAPNPAQAADWYRRAAALGNRDADPLLAGLAAGSPSDTPHRTTAP